MGVFDALFTAANSSIDSKVTNKTETDSISPVDAGSAIKDSTSAALTATNLLAGATFLTGTIPPTSGIGNDLDYYLQGGTAITIYKKVSGTWVTLGTTPLGITIVDGNISVWTIVTGDTIRAYAGQWALGNVIYQKATQTEFTIDVADPTLDRIDAVFGDNSNNVTYLAGTPMNTPAPPNTPANSVVLSYVYVPSIASGLSPYISDDSGQGQSNGGMTLNQLSGDVNLVEGANITFDIDPVTKEIVINSSGGGGGSTISAGTTSGTSTAYTATLSPAITAYNTNDIYLIQFNVASSASPTINLNSLGAKSLVGRTGAAIGANQLRTDIKYLFVYDGTNVKLISEAISPDALLETQTTPTEDGLSVSRRGLIYYWNWLKTQAINWGNTFQATRFGAGIAPNVAAKVTVAANTATEGQMLLTPSSTDYTGTLGGMTWNNGGVIKFRDATGQVDLLKSARNPSLEGVGSAMLIVTADGSLGRGATIDEGFETNPDVISALTSATYVSGYAEITPTTGVFYQGDEYFDETTKYWYRAIADNKVIRVIPS